MDNNYDDADKLVSFCLAKLENLADTFAVIEDINIRSKFKNWLFFVCLSYDGKIFGITKLPLIHRLKQNTLAGTLNDFAALVIPPGMLRHAPFKRACSNREGFDSCASAIEIAQDVKP